MHAKPIKAAQRTLVASPLAESPTTVDRQFASTLASAIDILACFKAGEYSLGNKDFAERTGLSRSAVVRLTHTLIALGYLRRAPDSRRYRLAPAVLTLGYPLLASMQIRQVARSLMMNLATQINGAVSMVMFDRLHMVYVETARYNNALPTHPDIGSQLPLLTTAAGRAWLSKVSCHERTSVLNRVRLHQPEYYLNHLDGFHQAYAAFEQEGFCSNEQAWNPDTYGFAVPMSKPIDSSLFVFNCGVPVEDGPFKERQAQIGPQLIDLVRSLERVLQS
ncbi:IclR family transcriptional regulator [Alcaligenes endophyticus]|uniref:IclR family transcriptional regulator n=1 Tax=Alcaligenes endophyticus TaxID=1929088 RepID=A0ABT8EJI7_9BURK|nr:IclR family transcriptional regulator [Alcaligenes endophyticus]MCX5591618.1 IclR family transcriptional regulator [Alcaligenes endophyticus]MDN4121295.1 IclR family transcriptional regulator [Alcaligenes endophyticus]